MGKRERESGRKVKRKRWRERKRWKMQGKERKRAQNIRPQTNFI